MDTNVRRCAVVALVVLSAACETSVPTSPTGTNQPQALTSPTGPPATNFPPLSGPSRTFVFDRELLYPVQDYTKKSRLVLYDNGAFVLRFPSVGEGGYRGGYSEDNGVITFGWEGWNVGGPWGATGALNGHSLTVQYNEIMHFTDFEDAVYALAP
jgi:hypothetical protein